MPYISAEQLLQQDETLQSNSAWQKGSWPVDVERAHPPLSNRVPRPTEPLRNRDAAASTGALPSPISGVPLSGQSDSRSPHSQQPQSGQRLDLPMPVPPASFFRRRVQTPASNQSDMPEAKRRK